MFGLARKPEPTETPAASDAVVSDRAARARALLALLGPSVSGDQFKAFQAELLKAAGPSGTQAKLSQQELSGLLNRLAPSKTAPSPVPPTPKPTEHLDQANQPAAKSTAPRPGQNHAAVQPEAAASARTAPEQPTPQTKQADLAPGQDTPAQPRPAMARPVGCILPKGVRATDIDLLNDHPTLVAAALADCGRDMQLEVLRSLPGRRARHIALLLQTQRAAQTV